MLGTAGVGCDERQIDVGALVRGQFALGLFGGVLEALQGHRIVLEVDAVGFLEDIHLPVNDCFVEIVAAQMGVAVGGAHFENTVAKLEDRDVESTAAEVVDGDFFVLLLVETVGQRSGSRFVDDAADFESGDTAGVLSGLALTVIKVGRYGDDRFGNGLAEGRVGSGLELGQDHRGDFRRRIRLVIDLDVGIAIGGGDCGVRHQVDLVLHLVELASDEALDRKQRVLRVGDCLVAGRVADQAFAVFGKRHD